MLYKELGVVDAFRFLKQFPQGYGNYTLEREVPFANKSLDEIVSEIKKRCKPVQKIVRAGLNFGPAHFLMTSVLIYHHYINIAEMKSITGPLFNWSWQNWLR